MKLNWNFQRGGCGGGGGKRGGGGDAPYFFNLINQDPGDISVLNYACLGFNINRCSIVVSLTAWSEAPTPFFAEQIRPREPQFFRAEPFHQ